ncbi:hypothetical protein GTP44_03985 [Duganella sp. FT50W]|uniref:Uncharacterized protein n=1 Tax=Duganella lactea TaxID=2692173 RepID=A0A6L8MP00_9BURK|nr:hypothetical protein [Duganella lactea]MYM81118.1 hypothetical protein [Duganella lactea]
MSNHEALTATLLAVFNLDTDSAEPAVVAGAAATVLLAFADAVRGPAPVVGELVAELAAPAGTAELIDEVRNLICEIRAERQAAAEDRRKHNRLFRSFMGVEPATGATASGMPG